MAVNYLGNLIGLLIQGLVAVYSALAVWVVALYWQTHPHLRSDLGYIDLDNINFTLVIKYLIVPSAMMILPNLLLGFYFTLVQKAVQTDNSSIGKRVGSILFANILGNTMGSLLTGLVLLEQLGTSGSIGLLPSLLDTVEWSGTLNSILINSNNDDLIPCVWRPAKLNSEPIVLIVAIALVAIGSRSSPFSCLFLIQPFC